MKKVLGILIVFIVFASIYVVYKDSTNNQDTDIHYSNKEEKIQQDSVLESRFYEDKENGLSLSYPDYVDLETKKNGKFVLDVVIEKITSNEGTMGYDKETTEKNVILLGKGDYGEDVDWPYENSKKVIKIAGVNAQDFVIFSRFDVCSIVFERKAYILKDGYRALITLTASEDDMIKEYPQYFNKENCGNSLGWIFDKQQEFYSLAKSGELNFAHDWLETFEKIVDTIKFNPPKQIITNSPTVNGKWKSLDDENSVIEFSSSKIIDYYQGENVSESSYTISGDTIIIGTEEDEMHYKILEITDSSLVLTYLSRGNTLRYQKID